MSGSDYWEIDDPVDRLLVIGAYNGDVELIVEALAKGAKADVGTVNDWTPLLWLCMRSLVGFDPVLSAKWLLAAGAEVNRIARNIEGNRAETALSLACEAGNTELVAFLLANGADPNAPAPVYPPLHAALPSVEMVGMLLRAGADRTRRFKGTTAQQSYEEGWGADEFRDEDRHEAIMALFR